MAKKTSSQRWKRYREIRRERDAADASIAKCADEFRASGMTDGQIELALRTVRRLEEKATPIWQEGLGFHMDSGVYDPRKPHPGYRRVEE